MKSSTSKHKSVGAGLAVTAVTSFLFAGAATAEPITVVSWGGSYGDAQDKALFNDASENTGIEIIRESGASMSK
ncbi:MAG: ABC transporter substrate-binding protein, partial [Pseudomonadota bacterium]